jgi:hypothetical protein
MLLQLTTSSTKRFRNLVLSICLSLVLLAVPSRVNSEHLLLTPTGTIIDSHITEDTTWTIAGSPYDVTEHIAVKEGVTLTIKPGVEIRLHAKRYFGVYEGASVVAKGTPDQPIIISDAGSGRWRKIWFYPNTTSYFRYTEFWDGGSKASGDDTMLYYKGPGTHVLNNCTIRASKEQGVVAQGEGLNLTIAGTLFRSNGRRDVMSDSGANVVITGSSFESTNITSIYLRKGGETPATITVNNSNILSSSETWAVYNQVFRAGGSKRIDAQGNWWGQVSGPHPGSVTEGVDYGSWLDSEVPQVGITTSPVATFTVSPNPTVIQPPGTPYIFDASGTTDAEDYASSLEVCWDWDDSGECDTDWTTDKTETHSFTGGAAVQTVRLFVRDTDDLISEATQELVLNSPPVADLTVDPDPGVDRLEGTEYEFDASDSSDVEDSTEELEVCWDWDNSGECDDWTTDKTEKHSFTYDDGAEQIVRLVVRDTADATDEVTETFHVLENLPPTATFTISRTTWNEIEFDASETTDDYDEQSDLQVAWDYEGDGDHNTSYVYFTEDVTTVYTYPHQGRYWPTLYAKDTGDKVGIARQTLDIIPPATSATLTGTTDALTSVDNSVQVTMSVNKSEEGTLLLYGIVVTHTPQLTPVHDGLDNDWLYQGFSLDAYSMLGDQTINAISGTYTITLSYDEDYFANVLGLPFEEKLTLYRWIDRGKDTPSYWAPVNFTLSSDDDRLVATTSDFGDFALVMDVSQIYLPLVTRSS